MVGEGRARSFITGIVLRFRGMGSEGAQGVPRWSRATSDEERRSVCALREKRHSHASTASPYCAMRRCRVSLGVIRRDQMRL